MRLDRRSQVKIHNNHKITIDDFWFAVPFPPKGKKGKRKRNENEIATAIRDFSHANMRSELAKQKLRFMEKEDQRQEKEDQRKEHRTLFDEWERLQSRLRTMRQDARDETLDKTTRQELEEDINGLVKRKNELATKLNLK